VKPSKPCPAENSETKSARALFEKRETILSSWIEEVKEQIDPEGKLAKPIIVNTIPLFLEKLSECLCEEGGEENPIDTTNFAQEHGSERARITQYGPEQLIHEYILLREIIRETLDSDGVLDGRSDVIIEKSIDKAVRESMASYFLVHGRIREQFVAGLTHDLRNPISAMKLGADLILETLAKKPNEAADEIRKLAQRITKSAKRADRMIQDLLDASVVQTGEPLNIKITQNDLKDIVNEAIGERPQREASNLKLKNKSIVGYWDAEAFQRSIENLIGNAFKYGDPFKPVTVSVEEAHDRVMVSVHNWGNPIPVETRESLFQVFRRSEAAKHAIKGWGIGLALARSTAERMGGSLGVESSAETGTTFTIDVPRDARPFQDTPTSAG